MKTRKFLMTISIIITASLFFAGLLIFAHSYSNITNPKLNLQSQNGTINKDNLSYQTGESIINTNAPVNILLMGVDEYGVRTDIMELINYSPKEQSLNMLSIPRDSKVQYKGKTLKINALTASRGVLATCEKVTEITGLPIHYYASINFKGFRKLIDELGGVKFNVPFYMKYDDPAQNLHIYLKKGLQTLNGNKAEQLIRYRKGNKSGQGYNNGDIGRIKVQQDFVKALFEQKLRWKYISKVDNILALLHDYMKTNVGISDIRYYISYLPKIKVENIKTYTVIGDSEYTNKVWYFKIDVNKTQDMIDINFFK